MKRSRLVFNLTRAISSLILASRFEVQIQGLANLPEKGPAFLIPKHQQWWDVPLLGQVVPRPLYFLAKQELFRSSLGRYFISRLGGIPVDRECSDQKSVHFPGIGLPAAAGSVPGVVSRRDLLSGRHGTGEMAAGADDPEAAK